jgi:hypothetical protein
MELQGQLQYDALVRQLGVRMQIVTPNCLAVVDFVDNFARNCAISFRKNKKSDNFLGIFDDFLRGPDRARSIGANQTPPAFVNVGWSTAPGMHDLRVPIKVGKAETFSVKLYLPRGFTVGVAAVHEFRVAVTIGVQNLEELG